MTAQLKTSTDIINSLSQNGVNTLISSKFGKCPICGDDGWELYTKVDEKSGIEYEFAKKCSRCHGNNDAVYQERHHRSGMPPKYNSTIGIKDFDVDLYSRVSGKSIDISRQMNGVYSLIKDFYKWEEKGYGLYIYSAIKGSGKSFLASCICNELMRKYCISTKYISANDLLDISKEENGLEKLKKIKLLILDDLGAMTGGVDWMADILFKLIDYRNNNKLVTIYTSNVRLENLQYGERVTDRINEKSMQLSLPEVSVRATNSLQDKKDFFKEIGL